MTSFKRAACSDLEELDATVAMKLRMLGIVVFLSRFILMHRFINLIGENTDALAPECPGRLGHLRCQAAVAKEGQKFFGILKRDFVSRSFNSGNTFAGKDAAKIGVPGPGPR